MARTRDMRGSKRETERESGRERVWISEKEREKGVSCPTAAATYQLLSRDEPATKQREGKRGIERVREMDR